MSLILSVTGQIDAGFWIELEDGLAVLHLKTKTALDKEKRTLYFTYEGSGAADFRSFRFG